MKYIHPRRGPWRTLHGDDGPVVDIAAQPHLLLTQDEWAAVRERWPQGMPVGVRLANDAEVEDLADDLPRLGLVALAFPKWTDGRAYSQARLLRARHRFQGAIRARGEVLVDMLQLLHRTGFDEAQLRGDQSQEAARRALAFFAEGFYQGDVHEARPVFAR